jgi:hypothetical protein
MKRSIKIVAFISFILAGQFSSAQIIASGESSVYKKGNEVTAYYEAVENAQRNAVIIYGGNISYKASQATSNTKISTKENRYSNSDNLVKEFQSLFGKSFNSSVKTQRIIQVDTVTLGNKKIKIRIKGNFIINSIEASSLIGNQISNSKKQVRIIIIENNCQGDLYKYLSEYFNRKQNNFHFSKIEWPLFEDDYLLEINRNEIILKNTHQKPNITLKVYHYDGCANIIKNSTEENIVFNEIINDIYFLYLTQLVERKK